MQSTVSYTSFVHDTLSLSNMCHSYGYYCIIIEYTQGETYYTYRITNVHSLHKN